MVKLGQTGDALRRVGIKHGNYRYFMTFRCFPGNKEMTVFGKTLNTLGPNSRDLTVMLNRVNNGS